ncbi:MAG: type IV secretion system protein TraC, partial [Rhodobacteraceae bacterium]|nr:type IV secretion system protein TraC [Paracoccaceae bacterium]
MHKTFQRHKIADLFPALAYAPDDKLFLLSDRTLGFGFLCRPLSGVDTHFVQHLNTLLTQNWPDETLLQLALWASPDIADTMNRIRLQRATTQGPLFEALTERRIDYLERATAAPIDALGDLRVRHTRLIVTAKIKLAAGTPSGREMAKAGELRAAAENCLKNAGLAPTSLNASRYIRLVETLLNWENPGWRETIAAVYDENALIRDQLADYNLALTVDHRGIDLNEARVKVLSAKRLPQGMMPGNAIAYLGDVTTGNRGLRRPCLLTLNVYLPNQENTKFTLGNKRNWITNQASTPIAKFLPRLGERRNQFDILFRAVEDGDRLVKIAFGCLLFTERRAEAADVTDACQYFNQLGFQMLEDRFFCLPLFLNYLPLGADAKAVGLSNRYRTVASSQAVPIAPVFADWTGTGTPTLTFVSRNGQLMSVSPYDSNSDANCCIAAKTGSGKSFLTNELILNFLAEGAQVWVIDLGHSYQNLCELLHGDYMEFTAEADLDLNPFRLVLDWSEEADIIAGLVEAMAAPRERLDNFQSAGLKRVLKGCVDAGGNAATIDAVAERLLKESDARLRDIGHQLFPFTRQGECGRYFNGRRRIDFKNPFTVLELEELKGRKHLQQIVLLTLIYQIQQEMYRGERNRPKLVIIDEAWDLLTQGEVGSFVEHGYRRFRKYGGSAITLTQSMADLYRNEAIVANSANIYLMRQKEEVIEALKRDKRLPFSEQEYDLLKSVHTIPGVYSEVFLVTERGRGIGRLYVEPEKQLLYSTTPEETHAIKRLRQQGMSLMDAIGTLLKERGERGSDAA